jgi:primary-amine oxidase
MPRALPPLDNPASRPASLSPQIVEAAAGFSAGVVSCLTVHPLDLLKNRLQLNTSARSRPGDSLRIIRSVVRDEGGLRALYRGLWPNMLGNSLGWGLYFLFYGEAKAILARGKEGGRLGGGEFFGAAVVAGMARLLSLFS